MFCSSEVALEDCPQVRGVFGLVESFEYINKQVLVEETQLTNLALLEESPFPD